MLKRAIIALALVVGSLANAADENLGELEQRYMRLTQHQQRLELQLKDVADRATRLKQQASTIGRDLQLDRSLKESQGLASRLTRINRQRERLEDQLARLYRKALATQPASPKRSMWQQRLAQLERNKNASPALIVATGQPTALDSAEELDAKADLLLDSQERVARQLQQVEVRLAQMEQREALLRHGNAAEDSLFVEGLSRRVGNTRAPTALVTNSGPQAGGRGDGDASALPEGPQTGANYSGSPSPSAPAGDNGGESAGPPGNGGPSETVSLREVLDPMIFETVKRSGGSASNFQEQITVLRKARAQLQTLSSDLEEQSKRLRRRSTEPPKQPLSALGKAA